MSSYLLRNLSFADESSGDMLISGGVISEISQKRLSATGVNVIDCEGMLALPGFVDLHTHLREPGREDSETIETGARAAALGGFTAIHAMANTNPVADTAGVVEQVFRLGREAGWCEVRPVGAVTVGLAGERLAELRAMSSSAASVKLFSDDGKCVSDPLLMRRALEYVKAFDGVIAQHAQDPRLTIDSQMNESAVSSLLGLTGWPAVAEESIISRDVLLAQHTDSRLHICHVSTAGSVEVLRWAKSKGIKVTAEVTPHHLLLTDDSVTSYDARYKVNPPLRTREDVQSLRLALADGTIDAIATDHAPHPVEDKDCEWSQAAFGMIGLQSAFSVITTALIDTGLMTWAQVSDRMSKRPATIAGLRDQGQDLVVGSKANIVVVNPDIRKKFSLANNASKSTNSPFLEMELRGAVMHTFYQGRLKVRSGELCR